MEYKALVIEDDPVAVEMIEEAITALGHTYDLAGTLVEARRLMQSNGYSYVLLDIAFPTRTPGGTPRGQNAENFLDDLAATKGPNATPAIIMNDRIPEGRENTERLLRLVMSLGVKGAKDLIQKPLFPDGRTLDGVIKKVLAGKVERVRIVGSEPAPAEPSPAKPAPPAKDEADEEKWLTVTDAAKLLAHDLPGLDIKRARSRISTAASRHEFKTKGNRRDRRIEPATFAAWRLKQRDRDLDEQDEDEAT